MFSKDFPIKVDVLDKLSKLSKINISIHDIYVPEVRIDTVELKVA